MVPICVLVVDDHPLVREGMRRCLTITDGLEVVGLVGDAEAAVSEAKKLRPDVVLMDIEMPGLDAFEGQILLQDCCPNARVVFLSAHIDRLVHAAMRAEAAGFVAKGEELPVIVEAIRQAHAGEVYYSPEIRKQIGDKTDQLTLVRSLLDSLTARETEVLKYIAGGLSRKEIASLMDLSVRTVECHCSNMMTKLEIHDRVKLTRFALRAGLVDLDGSE